MNTLTVLVTYSFNIVDWTEQELQRKGRKIHRIMTTERIHRAEVGKDRMYMKRSEGRSAIQLETR